MMLIQSEISWAWPGSIFCSIARRSTHALRSLSLLVSVGRDLSVSTLYEVARTGRGGGVGEAAPISQGVPASHVVNRRRVRAEIGLRYCGLNPDDRARFTS